MSAPRRKLADTAKQSKQRLDCVGFILPGHRAHLTTAPSPKELKPKRALLQIVTQLIKPEVLVEVEAIAASK